MARSLAFNNESSSAMSQPAETQAIWIDPESGYPFNMVSGCHRNPVPVAVSAIAGPLHLHPRSLLMYTLVVFSVVVLGIALAGIASCIALEIHICRRQSRPIASKTISKASSSSVKSDDGGVSNPREMEEGRQTSSVDPASTSDSSRQLVSPKKSVRTAEQARRPPRG